MNWDKEVETIFALFCNIVDIYNSHLAECYVYELGLAE